MTPLAQLVLVRLREFFREPSALFWTYGFPTLLALALGIAFQGGGGRPVPVAVLDGPRQQDRIAVLQQDPLLLVTPATPAEADTRFLGGRLVLAVGGGDEAEYRFDPTHPESDATRRRVDDLLQRAAGRADAFPTREARIEAPGSRYIDFLVPGLVGMNIMSSSMWGIGYSLVEGRKRKLLKRLSATPMRRVDFVLSFILARLFFLATEVSVILVFAVLVFDLQVQGSLAALALVSIAGAMTFAGLGMLAAARTASTETVSGLMNLIMLPMFVFSGVFFSSAHFPDWMQPFVRALPLTLMNDAFRAVINEGASLVQVAGPLAALALGAVLTLFAAIRLFRWT